MRGSDPYRQIVLGGEGYSATHRTLIFCDVDVCIANQMLLLSLNRRRRTLRRKLDEASRQLTASWYDGQMLPSVDSAPALRRPMELAVITKDGRVLVSRSVAKKPFAELLHKIEALRMASKLLNEGLGEDDCGIVHVRGRSTIMACYELRSHVSYVCWGFLG